MALKREKACFKLDEVGLTRVNLVRALSQLEILCVWDEVPDASVFQAHVTFADMEIDFLLNEWVGVFEDKHALKLVGALVSELKASLLELHCRR